MRTGCGGAIAVIDGRDGVGQVLAKRTMEEAVARAGNHGIGAVAVRNSNHFGTAMCWTRLAASAGCSFPRRPSPSSMRFRKRPESTLDLDAAPMA